MHKKNKKNEQKIMSDELFNLKDNEEVSSFMKEQKSSDDGLLRPKLEQGKDGKRELVIRLLPNLQQDGKLGPTAITKHIHYAKFPQNPELQGYFDCLKNDNIGKDCPLCKTFWALKNSKKESDEEKARQINRSTKYYAYAYVVEDEQVPENEGKIFIYPFGYKIYQKIKAQAESKRKPVKVEDLIYGANLNLIIEEVGGYYNYDASHFEAPGPIEINGEEIPVKEDGTITKATKKKVVEFLMSRETELESFEASDWTPEQYDNVDKIVAILLGQPYSGASSVERPTAKKESLTSSSVFDDDDDDEDDDEEEVVVEKKSKKSTSKKVEDEDEDEDTPTASARKKAAAFFDDED